MEDNVIPKINQKSVIYTTIKHDEFLSYRAIDRTTL